jgi:threonine synthase
MFMTGYSCVACGAGQPVDFAGYLCPRCGNNLDVQYDYALIRRTLSPREIVSGLRGDLFRFEHLLPVHSTVHKPGLRVGATPLYPAPRLAESAGLRHVYLKDESGNPSGSLKDRASALAVTRAREMGTGVIACASTGNAGSSLACLAASTGMPCVVVVPHTAPAAKLAQIMIFGARILAVRGTYDQAYDLCRDLCDRHGWFNRNTGYNPFTREGKKTCSYEICRQLHGYPPDRVVVPTGDGNIISAVWKGFQECLTLGLIPHCPKIDAAQAAGSAAITRTVHEVTAAGLDRHTADWAAVRVHTVNAHTVADSIAVDRPRDGLAAVRAVVESGGEAVTAEDDDILEALGELGRLAGAFVEPSCAVTWACLKKMARQRQLDPAERIVCLLTGSGLKDIAAAQRAAGRPRVIEPTVAAADQALAGLAGLR